MITAAVWLIWLGIGWTIEPSTDPLPKRLLRSAALTAAAVCLTIAINS